MSRHVSWMVALAALAAPAMAQINVGTRNGSGQTVGMGTVKEDPNLELNRMRKAYEAAIKQANDYMTQKRFAEAYQSVEKAKSLRTSEAQSSEILALYERINAEGMGMLGEAVADYKAGNYARAMKSYRLITNSFPGLPCGAAAREELKKSGQDETAQASMQDDKAKPLETLIGRSIDGFFASSAGKAALEGAAKKSASKEPTTRPASRVEQIKLMPQAEVVRVARMMETLVRTFPASTAGKQAAADLKELKADKVTGKYLARPEDSEAGKALVKADNYRKAGFKDKAVGLYEELVEKYPDTQEAGKAKEALAELK